MPWGSGSDPKVMKKNVMHIATHHGTDRRDSQNSDVDWSLPILKMVTPSYSANHPTLKAYLPFIQSLNVYLSSKASFKLVAPAYSAN